MNVREIQSLEELKSIRGEWLALWKRSSTATPFQAPDWIIPWWEHFGAGRLCVLVLSERGRFVGLAPFFVKSDEHVTLRFLGTGNTDYLDVLVDDSEAAVCVSAIFNHLCKIHRWDKIDLQNLRCDSPLFPANTCADLRGSIEEQDACPVLSLPSSIDKFRDGLSPKLEQNLSYERRRLARLGEIAIEPAVENNFAELFDAFVALHEARWSMNNSPGVLSDGEIQSFHADAAAGLLADGALRLYALRINGRIIACLYGFHHAQRTYYYLSGFDPEFAQYSPGNIVVAHAIYEAIGEGATAFDFLRGRESYKYRWGAVDQTIYRKQLTRPGH